MSAITILGVPAEIYIYNTQNWLIIASYVILFPSVALLFVPVFRAVDISSFYKSWLKKRLTVFKQMHRGLCKEKPEWKGMEIIKEMHTIAVN
ncbi:hypothetical protein pdam_00001215 [Pocillopora damicornis]|uniref:Uncharacterized protein n=1 Tax=Pocillopora damicornis TaxID=46731 RepID=A0A3M6TKM1_POCDA|nr:hypothetical protein pdam_00001215 [Pocillopora damicornis]